MRLLPVLGVIAASFITPAKADLLAYATHPEGLGNDGLLGIYYNQPYLPFTTKRANQRVKITFSANCNSDGYLYLRSFVDNQLTYTDNNVWSLFCAIDANGHSNEKLVTKIQTFEVKTAGRHNFTVEAQRGGGYWHWLYAINVTVEN
jgi:hypothetical protein